MKGKKSAQDGVVKLAPGQAVQLDREGTDKIFVVLVEFGDKQYPNPIFQGPPPDGSTTDVTGPLHNQIPEPNRAVDNSTLWQSDYNRTHYEDMYFNRMAAYYETQSSGRYSVEGDGHRLGQGPVQRGALRSQLLRQHRLRHQQGAGA